MAEATKELARVHAAFVAETCEHREVKAGLVARVKALEADLQTAKNVVRAQDYAMQQPDRAPTLADAALEAENAALRKRLRELDAQEGAREALRQRVQELEHVEKAWRHLSAVFAGARREGARQEGSHDEPVNAP